MQTTKEEIVTKQASIVVATPTSVFLASDAEITQLVYTTACNILIANKIREKKITFYFTELISKRPSINILPYRHTPERNDSCIII